MVWRYKQQYTNKTLTLRKKYVYASERAYNFFAFSHYKSKNCYFFQYFVGTSDTLSVQINACLLTCTSKFPNAPTKL